MTNWIDQRRPPEDPQFCRASATVPENLWVKCPETGEMVFHKDLEANQFVIPIPAITCASMRAPRFRLFFDDGDWETHRRCPKVAVDPLNFRDERRYTDRLKAAQGQDRARGRGHARRRHGRGPAGRRRRAGFRLHGRLARHGGRRGDHRRRRGGASSASAPLRAVRRLRRRAHAGRHPVADAAAAHHRRGRHG